MSGKDQWRIVLAVLAIFVGMSWFGASASDISKIYFDRHTWQNMDWKNADHSSVWNGPGWEDYVGKDSDLFVFTKKQHTSAQGIDLEAHLAYQKGKYLYQYFTTLVTAVNGVDSSGCSALLNYATKQFGKPITVNEDIHIPVAKNTFMAMTDDSYQWDIGETRISATCDGTATVKDGEITDREVTIWSIRFGHTTSAPKLEPRANLDCDIQLRHNDGSTSKLDDQLLVVDTYYSRVLNANLTPISNHDTYEASETQIKFIQETQNGYVFKYTLNRVSGSIRADVSQSGTLLGQIFGTCQKVDKLEKKF